MEEAQKKQLERIKKITKVKIGEHELKLSDLKPLKYGEMKKLKVSLGLKPKEKIDFEDDSAVTALTLLAVRKVIPDATEAQIDDLEMSEIAALGQAIGNAGNDVDRDF